MVARAPAARMRHMNWRNITGALLTVLSALLYVYAAGLAFTLTSAIAHLEPGFLGKAVPFIGAIVLLATASIWAAMRMLRHRPPPDPPS